MDKAQKTRLNILQNAFELVYRNGFQATSIDEVIATTKVTKGAFFYHFKNKNEMGLALIKEVMYANMYPALVQPLLEAKNPITAIYKMMEHLLLSNPFMKVKYGCPANNLIQEMAPLNKDFSKALTILTDEWENALVTCINKGKKTGLVAKNINPRQVATFIISGYGGIRVLGRLTNNTECYNIYLSELKRYLKRLQGKV